MKPKQSDRPPCPVLIYGTRITDFSKCVDIRQHACHYPYTNLLNLWSTTLFDTRLRLDTTLPFSNNQYNIHQHKMQTSTLFTAVLSFALANAALMGNATGGNVTWVTDIVTAYTTYCPASTTFEAYGSTYTVSEVITTLSQFQNIKY